MDGKEKAEGGGMREESERREEGETERGGLTKSEAPNTSFETGAGEENTGFDAPAIGSQTLSNEEYFDLEKTRNRSSTTGETGEGIEPGDQAREAE